MKRSRSLSDDQSLVVCFLLLAVVLPFASAHIMMSSPAPRQSKDNPGPNGQIDFDYTSPLGRFPCKGYPAQASVLTVAAGGSIPITLTGGATHDGGHCQFALSYDGDRSFVVIDTIFRECLRRGSPFQTTVTIPASAPSGKATLAWSWINAVGNREYYMSCTDIDITGGSGPQGSLTGPELLVAHLPGFSAFAFPEFPGNSPDNRELFAQRRQITVRGNGSGGGGGAPGIPVPPSSPSPTSTTTPPSRPTVPGVPVRPTVSPTPPPSSTAQPTSTSTTATRTATSSARPTRTRRPRPGDNLQDPAPPSNDLAPPAGPTQVAPPGPPRIVTPTPRPPVSTGVPPSPSPPTAECTLGDMRCDTDLNFFLQCDPSRRLVRMPVPRDTQCGTNARGEVDFVYAGPTAPGT